MKELQYPVGKYIANKTPDSATLTRWIDEIRTFPHAISKLTENLEPDQLSWCYRPGGWSIKQLVHHCADSHLNSIIRFKLALTEKKPEIRPYYEDRWAELPDAMDNNINLSLSLIKALHEKWVFILENLTDDQLKLEFIHPEHGAQFNLAETIGSYAWHCRHHLAHIEIALKAQGKY